MSYYDRNIYYPNNLQWVIRVLPTMHQTAVGAYLHVCST